MRFQNWSFVALASIASITAVGTTDAQNAFPPSTFVGGAVEFGAPQGDFSRYVHGAFGIGGHLVQSLDERGILALRAELNIMAYGRRTARQSLGGGALSLIDVDVTTTNSIAHGSVGLQLMAPIGTVRPYLTGGLGFSYFWTQSEIEGSDDNDSPFASTENFHDSGFATNWGGGLYIPLRIAHQRPLSLDFGVRHSSCEVMIETPFLQQQYV